MQGCGPRRLLERRIAHIAHSIADGRRCKFLEMEQQAAPVRERMRPPERRVVCMLLHVAYVAVPLEHTRPCAPAAFILSFAIFLNTSGVLHRTLILILT
eukprot:scaffold64896_cov33-Tisochrysis_lutea.AAC.1